ncbi:unnamed protein product [Toxocara canis]|uniref:DUF148 domain-containing protein n=1 Tax=Toxocara canis TaxID=6265 RepID=A0A183UND6_TOXCA|nr:unnamed protein product [Toxocara canis]
MNYPIVLAGILPLLCHLTFVDARIHGEGRFPPRRHGEDGSISMVQIVVFGEGLQFGFAKLCSRWNPFARWWQPEFLKNVSDEGFKQFCEILTNQNLTKAEIREQLEQWAKNQGSDVYDEFKKFVEEKKQKRDNIERNMEELIIDATKFIEDVKNIMNDMSLTRNEEREKVTTCVIILLHFQLFDLAKQTNGSVLVLAAMIRMEAGFPKRGHHGRPCRWCRPMLPPMPLPNPHFRLHGSRHFGSGMPGREPGFPEDGFRPNVPYGRNWPFSENRFPFGKDLRWGMNVESTGVGGDEIWSENDFQDDIFDNE